jgi:site-specific DNA-cytosine methylase
MKTVRKTLLHFFGAIGGGALGFKRARVEVAGMEGEWQCLGSIDVDARANRVFARRVGVPALDLDLASRQQYIAINGREPPEGWREATPADLRAYCRGIRPDCIFLSAPCKGFSGLLPEAKSVSPKYAAMNELAQRALWLIMEAWPDDPVPLILFENVPRLLTRGRPFVDQCIGMLRAYGYLTAETVHDCGELGGLGQSRKRCLIVARHPEKIPNFLYEPPRRALRSVGDVIGGLWMPGDAAAGPLHRVPRLQWKTWVRLAFVEAGSDWRSLNRLAVENGHLRDYLIVPEMHRGGYGVRRWEDPSGVVQSESRPSNGSFSVADPRVTEHARYSHAGFRVVDWDGTAGAITRGIAPGSSAQQVADPRLPPAEGRHESKYRVTEWESTARAVTSSQQIGSGALAVADPRHTGPAKHSNEFRIVRWDGASQAVTGAHGTGSCVADPRGGDDPNALHGKWHVTPWGDPSRAVIGGNANGAAVVADPRAGMDPQRSAYLTGGHYGVTRWGDTSGAVSASACHDNGPWSVADPRELPAADEQLVCVIRSLDGTWHRPFTTLELAALQSLFDPEDPADVLAFTGAMTADTLSDSQHREWIGNAVPSEAAEAVAGEMLRTLLLADAGETFSLSAASIWVRPYVAALQLARGGDAS